MDNIFYLFGILYCVVSIYNFFTYDHKRDVGVNLNTFMYEVNEKKEETKSNFIEKYYPRNLLGFMFFIWTYIGCVGDFPQRNFFIVNMVVLILYFFIILIIVFFLTVKAYRKIECNYFSKEKEKRKKIYLPLTKYVYFLEMILVAYILIIHYFIL